MDAYDYLRTGVMNGNPGGMDIPEDIDNEMVIAMLDTCDDIIDSYRRTNRAFDVGCDDNFVLWTTAPYAFEDLRVGMRASCSPPRGSSGSYVSGEIIKINNPYEQRVPSADGSFETVMVTRVIVDSGRKDQTGYNIESSFSNLDWENGASHVVVPVPTDGSTLGKYPPKF